MGMKRHCFKLFVLLLAAAGVLKAAPPRVILVFPLENLSGQANLGWMSEGLANLLSTRLNSPTRYVLSRQERNAAYLKLGLTPDVSLTLASEYEVAQALASNVAVVGHFSVKQNQLSIEVQWLDVEKLRLSQPVRVSGNLGDMAGLETSLAWKLVSRYEPGEAIGSEQIFSQRFPPVRLDAFENYIRGILATDSKSKIHFLRESELLDPSDHRSAFQLGRYYFEQKDYASSARWLQMVAPSDAGYSESLFLLGIDQHLLGYDVLAEKALKQLAGQVPLGAVMNNLGVVELSLHHDGQALADFQNAYEKDQLNPDLLYNLGVCLWRMQRYGEGAQYLRKALHLSPEDPDVRRLLAYVVNHRGGDRPDRRQLPSGGGGKDPANDPVTRNDPPSDFKPQPRIVKEYDGRPFRLLALAIRRATETRLAEQPKQVVHDDGQVHLKQGLDLLSAGRLPKAEQQLAEAVALLPGDSAAHFALGEVYQREGKYTLAAAELEASLNEKESVQAHLWLAKAYLSLKHARAAAKQAQAVLRIEPSNVEAKALLDRTRKPSSLTRGAP